jgi:signal transduction histidine kinase
MTILHRARTHPGDRRATEAFAFRDLRARLQRIGLGRILVALDSIALLLVAATYLQLGPPELLFHGVFVVLTIDAFVFGRGVTYWRIAASSLVMLGYVLLPVLESEIEPLDLTEWPLMFAIAILVAMMADRERGAVRRYARLYRNARERLVTAEEQERTRLSRDLHDGLGQTLTALSLALDGAGTSDERVQRNQLRRARRLTDMALADVRATAERIRPPRLHERGLESALRQMAATCGGRVELDLDRRAPLGMAADTVVEVFRIGQEALTNAVRHAAADHIRMRLAGVPGGVLLELHDDGRGFDAARVGPRRLGLAGMRERAATIGATLTIQTAAGRGTHVSLLVPAGDAPPILPGPAVAVDEGARP